MFLFFCSFCSFNLDNLVFCLFWLYLDLWLQRTEKQGVLFQTEILYIGVGISVYKFIFSTVVVITVGACYAKSWCFFLMFHLSVLVMWSVSTSSGSLFKACNLESLAFQKYFLWLTRNTFIIDNSCPWSIFCKKWCHTCVERKCLQMEMSSQLRE